MPEIVCEFVDTTRSVYQRKLARWLKYGPSHVLADESSRSFTSADELQLDASHTQSETVLVTDTTTAIHTIADIGNGHSQGKSQGNTVLAADNVLHKLDYETKKKRFPVDSGTDKDKIQLPYVSQG